MTTFNAIVGIALAAVVLVMVLLFVLSRWTENR